MRGMGSPDEIPVCHVFCALRLPRTDKELSKFCK
jgi:hypothetical protein